MKVSSSPMSRSPMLLRLFAHTRSQKTTLQHCDASPPVISSLATRPRVFSRCSIYLFLCKHGGRVTPRTFDNFDLWKRIKFRLPIIPKAGARLLKNIVHASPPVPAKGRCPPEPAHLDFALIRTAETNQRTRGSTLEGMCCIIFQLGPR